MLKNGNLGDEEVKRVLQLTGDLLKKQGRVSTVISIYRKLYKDVIFDFAVSDNVDISLKNEIESLGGRVFILNGKNSIIKIRNFIRKLLANNDYDYVHYHAISMWGCVQDIVKENNVTLITESHSATFSENKIKRLRNKIFSANISKYTDKRVAVSPEAGENLFGKKEFTYIPNWIDCKKFCYKETYREQVRKKLGIPQNDIVIGQVGRINTNKNQLFSLKVFKRILSNNGDYHLIFIGEGTSKEKNRLLKFIDKHNVDNIHFIDYTEKIERFYSAFDILWMPSHFEGLPTVSLEANSSGIPVILSETITREADVGNDVFLPLKEIMWERETYRLVSSNRKTKDQVLNDFKNSVFNERRVISKWKELYGLNH